MIEATGIYFTLLTLVCLSMALDKRMLSKQPHGMESFDVKKYTGRWYIMLTMNPCSWRGADTFTDWYHEYELDRTDRGLINGNATWRKDDTCVRVPLRLKMTGKSCLIVQDSIGDISTGDAVVVATDYTCFLISWGCTKRGVDGRTCSDAWADLKTRKPIITHKVRRIADKIFQKLWGLSTYDIQETSHARSCETNQHWSRKTFLSGLLPTALHTFSKCANTA